MIFYFENLFKIKYHKNNFLGNNEELTKYINKIFEQQEKERIVRWLVNSIRESLDLDKMLETIVEEIGKLLKVDRCLIALFEKEDKSFYFKSEYKKNKEIASILNKENSFCEMPDAWYDMLVKDFYPVIVNDSRKNKLSLQLTAYLKKYGIKSLIIIPVIHKGEILGIIMVHQADYLREWEDAHFEILKDTGSQIAIAIGQAILYTKIQEATRLKSEFLTGMSHELRTPLNAIIGFSDMLLHENYGKLNEKQKKFLNNISISGEHLLRLVNDILDLSKIESGNIELNYEKFNICAAINEAVSVLNSLAMKKNITIKMDIEANLFINADLRRFKQIMYNLLSNAVKFTPDNGEIQIKAFQDTDNLNVEIYDNGIGIPEHDRDKVFKNFSQLDSSLLQKQEGTGLGLTLTRKLIEIHKGKIDFESEKGKGSKFWFVFPGIKIEEKQDLHTTF